MFTVFSSAHREPRSLQQDQHGTAANSSRQSGSNPAYTNLDVVHQETLDAMGQAGSAFQAMLATDNATEQKSELYAQWAAPEKQRYAAVSWPLPLNMQRCGTIAHMRFAGFAWDLQ